MNEYHKQAEDFLSKNGIEFTAECLGVTRKWGMVRFYYSVTMIRTNKVGKKLTFESPFYGSHADYLAKVKQIHAYDFLACISGSDFRSASEIIREFGSGAAEMDIEGILEESRKVRKFFTPRMRDELSEIN
jgi:hypothetical protein